MERGHDAMRWVRLAGTAFVLVVGWIFVAWQNRFHITAPVVFACIAYFAVVMVVWNLWRTGATAVSADQYGEEAWVRPVGARDMLEKEKRTLFKAIREAEFDRDMGKLSKADAAAMIKTYKDRAIEVIKALEGAERTSATVREKIEREVKARVQVDSKRKGAKA
ncbi:MAG TPA: hypothetical protein VGF94_09405 [Kofleriaceae bacterium]|jgi:hypothetical protein